MNKQQAIDLVKQTFESAFDKSRFSKFIRELLNEANFDASFSHRGQYIYGDFEKDVSLFERIAKYSDGENEIDILIVHLKKDLSIERARTMQRNFIAKYLNSKDRNAALVAFVSPNPEDWRFSLVKMEYGFKERPDGTPKAVTEFTPAKRWSFLVGSHEKSHTAQRQFQPILADSENNPTLEILEEAFNIEKVTKEFFEKYRDLFIRAKGELDQAVAANPKTKADFESKGIDTTNLAKKLLGQIIFLYFLQKKGWFGVPRDAAWGEGSRNFLRELFDKKHSDYKNFFNDILEPLFYEALRIDRSHDDHYYSRFNCKIPFLNGGLFDPMGGYDWVHTDILLPDNLFSNKTKTKEGDEGDGILDAFDRYNFTVKEDEPFEKEVAIDPELLGKAYEKFNAIRPDNYDEFLKALKSGKKGEESKFNKQYGVYYTPREIVHYMCQQSLINYLDSELNPNVVYQKLGDENLDMFGNATKEGQLDLTVEHHPMAEIPKEAIALLIQHGESLREHEAQAAEKETRTYSPIISEAIRKNAARIDQKLAGIKICDPAVGSGAFPVGMMSEIVKARQTLAVYRQTSEVSETSEVLSAYRFKRACIENSLYGVDIDAGAVEIAKLRLWLSLVVDEDDIQNIKPLPNLDYKVMAGNSLLGLPDGVLLDTKIKSKLEQKKSEYFYLTNPNTKQRLRDEISQLFSKLVESAKQYAPSLGNVNFDFHTHFSEVFHDNGGFDILIGNPPYIKEYTNREAFDGIRQSPYYQGKMDIWYFFACMGIELLKQDTGILSFIATNNWNTNTGASKFRNKIVKDATILTWLDFGNYKIFENADVQTMILICVKDNKKQNYEFDLRKIIGSSTSFELVVSLLEKIPNSETLFLLPVLKRSDSIDKPLVFSEDKYESILSKISRNRNFRLDESLEVAQGIVAPQDFVNGSSKEVLGSQVQVGDGIFVISEKEKKALSLSKEELEIIKPYYTSEQLQKYYGSQKNKYWIIYTDSSFKNKKKISPYPNIKNHLDRFRNIITSDNHPYGLHRSRDEKFFTGEKIISIRKSGEPVFTYTNFDCYVSQTFYIIKTQRINQKYLVGLLNSNLMKFWLRHKGKMQGYLFQVDKEPLLEIPIIAPTIEIQGMITKLVERILAAKGVNPQADTSALEKEIDELVYELYGLTDEEIKIIEGQD